MRLNPRFDGAFLNLILVAQLNRAVGLNPRFDGAFLNFEAQLKAEQAEVLIPDLMGLF